MKKTLLLLLNILIVLNLLCVLCYATDDSFVTKAISAVEEKINIPSNYTEFNSKLTVESGGQYAYFTWYGDDDANNPGGQISVTVDDKFRVLSFSQYLYGNFNGNYKLSDYTSDDAEKTARVFLSKACPEFYPNVRLWKQEYSVHRNFEPYNMKFIRYENGLPCYDDYINVEVNAENGMVSAIDVIWTDYDKIYPANTSVSVIDASIHMYDKIGMVKEYAKREDGSLYVRYADLSDGVNYVNAYTGNIINTNRVSVTGNYKNALTSKKDFDFWYAETPFDIETAVNVVENNIYITPGEQFELTGIQYLKDDYSKYLYMNYDNADGSKKIYIVDVITSDIRYYDYIHTTVENVNYNYSQRKCESIAEDFVLKNIKSFISNCRLLNYNNTKNYIGEDIYYFNYTRYINDIAYDSNGVIVGVSRSTGEIVSVRSGWDVVNVDSYSLTISQDDAFEKYIKESGFELQYVTALSKTQQMEMRAVYAPNPLYDVYVNAVTGDIIDVYGNVLNKERYMYKDIANDVSEEQIKTLYACNILDEAENFNPNDNVLLCDFLLWICRAIDCIEYEDITDVLPKLLEKGIVTYDEIISNQPINTEMGIKYIVSYLGYDKIAVLTDTFKTGFVDEGMISTDMIGYASIAKGLKIFQGNAFMPKDYIKRNVAAQILYNLISN